MPIEEKSSGNLWDQVMCLSSTEGDFSEADIFRSLKELMTPISPLESEAIKEMIENLHRDGGASETAATLPSLSLSLEITADKGAEPHLIPVTLKNLSSEMAELVADNFEGIRNLETLQGKKAILRLTDPESQESMIINAIMTWTQSAGDKKINVILRMLNAQSNNPASKILEIKLPASSKETQRFWNRSGDTQETKEYVDQRDNFLLLGLACGTIGSSFFDPKTFQIMQYLLSVIGVGNVIKFLRER